MGTKLKCNQCQDIIESKHRHDYVRCRCNSIFVDGGNDYLRYGGDLNSILVEHNNKWLTYNEISEIDKSKAENTEIDNGKNRLIIAKEAIMAILIKYDCKLTINNDDIVLITEDYISNQILQKIVKL